MGVDKSYGSGKPRSAANSRARQRVASGSLTKGPTKTNRALKKIAAQNPVTGFIGGGVLASKGFVQAAAKVVGAAQRRVGIQEIKQTMAARRGYSSTIDDKGRGVLAGPKSPLWKLNSKIVDKDLYAEDLGNMARHAARNAARDLNLTIGTRKTYTALKADAANTGRQLAKDVSKVNYAIDKYGGEVARTQLVKWAQRKESAQALAQEAKKYASIASKGTKRQAK